MRLDRSGSIRTRTRVGQDGSGRSYRAGDRTTSIPDRRLFCSACACVAPRWGGGGGGGGAGPGPAQQHGGQDQGQQGDQQRGDEHELQVHDGGPSI